MNDQTAISGRAVAKLEAGADIRAIVPTTIDATFRLAELIHQSGLAPYQLKNAAAVTVVFLKGLELGLPPMAALECIGVINGKACLHSDGIPSLLWSRGFKIREWYENEDTLDRIVAHCEITRPEGDKYTFKYSAQDAKENGLWDTRERNHKGEPNKSPWFLYKKRMTRMRCRGWLARDCAADVLKGIPIFEEQADIQLGRNEYSEVKPAIKAPLDLPDIPDLDQTPPPEVTEAPPKVLDTPRTDEEFKEALTASFATARDLDALNEHLSANEIEIEDRGLQQWAGDQYAQRKARLY